MTSNDWLQTVALPKVHRSVLRWYDKNARVLPWRGTRDPYRIWVSEVMLQQTIVAVVAEYYGRFLERFPTLRSLAEAGESEVLHAWQGLGYYRRARDLHRSARIVARRFAGQFPDSLQDIQSLPGLGRYTANAVACFAFHQKLPILEANTKRLWARVTAQSGSLATSAAMNALWHVADAVLPTKRCADFNQAVMDIGSQVCTPKEPKCSQCPLQFGCLAFQRGQVHLFPRPNKKARVVDANRVSVIVSGRQGRAESTKVLVIQRPPSGRWARLWEFPSADKADRESWLSAARRAVRQACDCRTSPKPAGLTIRHAIMNFRVQLRCYEALLGSASGLSTTKNGRWISLDELESLPFSSPQRKVARWLLAREGGRSGRVSPKKTPKTRSAARLAGLLRPLRPTGSE